MIAMQTSGNKELDSLAAELNKLQTEKLQLESDVHDEEMCLKLRQSDTKNVENEIETLHQMLKQLYLQKSEASKRLADLAFQNTNLETTLSELTKRVKEELSEVENLSQQLEEQKLKVESQESELMFKQKELQDLRSEESKLESQLESCKRDAENASRNAGDIQLEISQIKTKLMEVEEYERQLNDAINDINNAISSNDIMKISALLPRTITPPITEIQSNFKQNGVKTENDPFGQKEAQLKNDNLEFVSDPFAGEDPFSDDPFRSDDRTADPFSGGFANFATQAATEPFDPFGIGSFYTTANKADLFGNDSFQYEETALRGESPTPALPPKKSKAPPPRPAPPKHAINPTPNTNKTPLRAAPAPPVSSNTDKSFKNSYGSSSHFDPFNDNKHPFNTSATTATSTFANFANFDNA